MPEIDADALERAAKAVREIEKSKISRQVFEMSKRESGIKLAEEATKAEQYKAQTASLQKEQELVKWEEQRKTIEYNTKQQAEIAKYNAQIKAQQADEEDRRQRARDADKVKLMAQQDAKREALRRATDEKIQEERRKTDEFRARLERENMKARAIAEAEGRIREQRENEDVFKRQAITRGEQDRLRVKEAIDSTFSNIGAGFQSFISDKSKWGTTVGAVVLLAGGVYGAREAARVVGSEVARRMGKPTLVRETSRTAGHFGLSRRVRRLLGRKEAEGDFSDVVLKPSLAQRISSMAYSTANTRKNGAPYRHMLFYGPPGTGKTMVAKRLAKSSGMDYAIMTGGDVGPLGKDATTELHKLFDWANTSRRGVLLFIDEADAFLGSRSRSNLSEAQRNALNALLYRTGTASKKFMMVVATNRPADLDSAITDRVDESLWFTLPTQVEREALVRQYFKEYILDAGKDAGQGLLAGLAKRAARIDVDKDVTDEYLVDIARRTEGMSGRAISKLLLSVQGEVYGRQAPVLNRDLMEETIQYKLNEFAQREFAFEHLDEDSRAMGEVDDARAAHESFDADADDKTAAKA